MQSVEDVHDQLLFGVPKKGRLYEKVLKVLAGAGIVFYRPARLDIAQCTSLPLTLVFLPAHDIAQYVADGKLHLGITGQDIIRETSANVKTLMPLGFGKCKLCLQAPKGKYKDPSELSGGRIVTSFPTIAKEYFDELKSSGSATKKQKTGSEATETTIKFVSGSVEVACSLGLADGIVDLVETGTTMRAAGLEVVSVIMETQTVLVTKQQHESKHIEDLVLKVQSRIEGYLIATKHVMVSYNIRATDLAKTTKITPGMESPTVMPLNDQKWCSVSAIVKVKDTARVLDELAEAGARSILVTCLQNSRFPGCVYTED